MNTAKMVRLGALAVMAASMVGLTTGCCGSATCKQQEMVQMKSADFYADGKLDVTKAKAAYFEMMEKLGAPIYDVYRPNDNFMWVVDFGQKDFAAFGMGGVFWINNRDQGYFAHEIFLLPGQSIAEHCHHPTKDEKGPIVAKHESWQVRYGSVYGFSEIGEPNLHEFPEVEAMLAKCQKDHMNSLHVEKWEADGTVHELAKIESWHFMMGGPEGAVVSEYATFHHNSGLDFTCPGASLD